MFRAHFVSNTTPSQLSDGQKGVVQIRRIERGIRPQPLPSNVSPPPSFAHARAFFGGGLTRGPKRMQSFLEVLAHVQPARRSG